MHCLSHCRLFKLLNHYLATFMLGLLFQCFLFPGSLNWGVTPKDWPAFLRSWKNLLPIEVLFYFSFLSCPQRACHHCNKAYKITLNFKHCLFIFGFILYHRLNYFLLQLGFSWKNWSSVWFKLLKAEQHNMNQFNWYQGQFNLLRCDLNNKRFSGEFYLSTDVVESFSGLSNIGFSF